MSRKLSNTLLAVLPVGFWLSVMLPPVLPPILRLPTAEQIRAERARQASNRRERELARHLKPAAGVSFPIPVSSKALLPDGRSLTVTGTLTGTLDTVPVPVPPPLTRLGSLRDAVTGTAVVTAVPGQRLALVGETLIGGTYQRITVGGEIGPIGKVAATRLEFVVPAVPAGPTEVLLYWLEGGGWVLKGKLPLVIGSGQPGPVPVPVPATDAFHVDGYEDERGQRTDRLIINRPMSVVGTGFGSQPGKLWTGSSWLPIHRWTDTRIDTESGPGANPYYPLTLHLWRPGTGWVSGIKGPLVEER